MKLQSKLALSMAAAASVAIFLMAAAFWVIAAQEQRRAVDDFLLSRVDQVREVTGGGGVLTGRGPRSGQARSPFDQDVLLRFRFIRPDGTVLIDDGLPEVESSSQPVFSNVTLDGDRYRMLSVSVGRDGNPATFQVAQNIEDDELALDRLRRQLVVGSALGIGLAGLLGALLARRLSTPIQRVSAAAREMAIHQDLPSRIPVERSDEVGDLANSFNQMLSALELSRDQQKRLVADASHELRTPLTSLRLKIDLLDSNPDLPGGQRQELLAGAAVELEQLTDLVTELVDLATDPTSADEIARPVDLAVLAQNVATRAERSTGRTIDVVGEPSISPIRERMVARAISNLIDNAVKYSPADTPIVVTVRDGMVEVCDHGEGIPPADLDRIFDRFYRSSTAQTRPGNGIGLAIVQRVAELHGGTVWARSAGEPSAGPAATGTTGASGEPVGSGSVVGFSVATVE